MAIRGLGVDILGPFPRVPGSYRYLCVAVDKFTKWAELEAFRAIPAGSTSLHQLDGVVECCGPVEPTAERLPNEGS